ncbi:arginyl-tRNA--protein transferase 2 isoform X2 [Malania oleifera]|uniref:arginyl-tRNA--protein transferase 2 isoform X2 n=1 Tax=Malania oleifera TaxID=397392 RepID=UPI0025AE033D|nr:arginyl-tRNA--protein transferase 2 isoform X2 [Malania oleifera]
MAGKSGNEAGSSSAAGQGGRSSNRRESVVVDVRKHRSSCGYCKSGGRTSISHGLWAHSLTVYDYQDLLDRGWRRSGSFLYKPDMEKTCCPSYTIRLKAGDFVPSKEQLRVSRRMQRFLDGTLDVKKLDNHDISSSAVGKSLAYNHEENSKEEQFMCQLSEELDNVVGTCTRNGEFPHHIQLPKASVKKVLQAKRKLLAEGSEELLYSSNISFQIAATLKQAQSARKDVSQSSFSRHSSEENGLSPKLSPDIIAEKLASSSSQLEESFGLSIRACKGHINFYSASKQASLDIGLQRATVPEATLTECENKGACLKKSPETPEHPRVKRQKLEIRLKRSSFDPKEYALYRRYQINVHNDTPNQVTESSYKRFLVDTPLIYVPSIGDGTVPLCGFGSFHQQYWIDGQLVAVGVIDILPKCLSSKYLFWDPDFAFLSLGKYSAIQEIGWIKENQAFCPSLQYYYLGYYIHSCSKMRYKAAYRPSELLCPLRYQWVPYDIAKPLLDARPHVVLSDFSTSQHGESLLPIPDDLMEQQHDDLGREGDSNDIMDEDEEEEIDDLDSENSDGEMEGDDFNNVLIGLQESRLRYKDLRHAFTPAHRSCLHRYAKAVGAELSERMVYSLD